MINHILTAIMARVAELVPAVKYIDEDWGQLDYYNDNPPVRWPAVLMELQQTSWQNQGQKVQDGVMSIALTVADVKIANNSLNAPVTQKEKAAEIWLVIENIHKALHGWRASTGSATASQHFGTLSRVSTRRIKRDDGIRQFEVIYSCLCTDASAQEAIYNIADEAVAEAQFNTVPPELKVEVETD